MTDQPQLGTVGLRIEPCDTLFFRDGRPFDAASRLASGLPAPQTLAGALRTWLLGQAGCDFERLGAAQRDGKTFDEAATEQSASVAAVSQLLFRGPWFQIAEDVLMPIPRSLGRMIDDGEFVRLDPLKEDLPGWAPPDADMRPLWHRDGRRSRPLAGYLTQEGLRRFLAGSVPEKSHVVTGAQIFAFDERTGIAIDADSLSTQEGLIYAVNLLALAPGVTLYAEITGPEAALAEIPDEPAAIPLGGEGRRVVARRASTLTWPRVEAPAGSKDGVVLLLTAPGLFDQGWKPRAISPIAAAVPGYTAVSGWDYARRGPKPNRFAASAGSVYFLRERPAGLDVEGSLCAAPEAELGWGTYLEGVWEYV